MTGAKQHWCADYAGRFGSAGSAEEGKLVMEAKQGKVVRLYPAPSKVEADIPSMPTGKPMDPQIIRQIIAGQLEQVAGPTGRAWLAIPLCCAVFGVLAFVLALTK